MPTSKMKTHKGAAKRFKVTGGGKIVRHRAYGSHLLSKKSSKRKRGLRKPAVTSAPDRKMLKKYLPYGG